MRNNLVIFLLVTAIFSIFVALAEDKADASTGDVKKGEETFTTGDFYEPGSRTWTDSKGNTIEATYATCKNGKISLKKSDGTTLAIVPNSLSQGDQKVLAKYIAAEKDKAEHAAEGTLTDYEISQFKTEYVAPETKEGYKVISCAFTAERVNPARKTKYAASGKVPFRITFGLYATKEYRGKMRASLVTDSSCEIYILNSEGKLVGQKQSISLGKMCPS